MTLNKIYLIDVRIWLGEVFLENPNIMSTKYIGN